MVSNKVKFQKIGESKDVNNLEVSLLTHTEIRVKGSNINKVVDMRINIVGLELEIECTEKGDLQVRCLM